MRLLLITAAATLFVSGGAMAAQHHHHHHAAAPATEGTASADSMSPHDAHLKNLHDSGYNPSKDFDAAGNVRAN